MKIEGTIEEKRTFLSLIREVQECIVPFEPAYSAIVSALITDLTIPKWYVSSSTQPSRFWKQPGEGWTNNIEEAHGYTEVEIMTYVNFRGLKTPGWIFTPALNELEG